MCCPRQAESGRGNWQDAKFVVCCDNQWLSCGGILDHLKHAKQGKITAAELLAAGRHAVACGVTCHVYGGRLVRNGRRAIPGTRIRDTHEHRKRPQPQNRGGEELAMPVQHPRHAILDAIR
jgi:hypothetical protein